MMYINEAVNVIQNAVAPMFSSFRVNNAIQDYSHLVILLGGIIVASQIYRLYNALTK